MLTENIEVEVDKVSRIVMNLNHIDDIINQSKEKDDHYLKQL